MANKGSKMNYAKNAGRSLASAGVDAVGDLMPNLKRGIKSNKSLALNTYKKYKEDSTPFDIQKTYLYKSTKRLVENAINDTKSGNFNNKKREAENDSFANMFNLDSDFDDSFGGDSDSISMADTSDNSFDLNNLSVNADLDEETKFDIKATANISKANLRVANMGFATLTSQLKILNKFHNENTITFYNSMEEKLSNIETNMSLVGAYLTDVSTNSSRSYGSGSKKARKSDAFQMNGIAIQDWIDLYGKGKSTEKGSMSSMFEFFIKPEIEKMVANPMGWLSKTAIKTAIPKSLKNSMKDLDQLTGMLPMLAQGKFKDWSKNGNFLQKTLGNLLNLDKFKTKANKFKYEKGKIGFDGITKRAITHVIPGYLSRILTAVTKSEGDKNLSYDFDSGKFVNSKEAKKHYKASLENEIRGALSNDSNDSLKDFKKEILTSAKKNGTAKTDDDLTKLNEKIDQMMVGMTKRGMTFGNARDAKDLGVDSETADLIMNSYKGLKGKNQANIENILAMAWVDYEKKLDNLTEDSLFQSVYDRKSFNKKDSEFKKSKVDVSAKVSDTVGQVNSVVNKSNLSEGKKKIINDALNKINGVAKDKSRVGSIDGAIDKMYGYFTNGNNFGKEGNSNKESSDASSEVANISKNIEELANISMANMAIQANQSDNPSAVKFSKSMFNGIKTGKNKIVRTKIYGKMTSANGKAIPTKEENHILEENKKIESFNEDINNLKKKKEETKKDDKPIEVMIMGGTVDKVDYIEDIKEMADPKDPNSANEQRAKMREESKLRQELMDKNATDGHENVVTSSLKELMNPEGAGGGSGKGGFMKDIIGETVGEVASSMLLGGGGSGKLFGKASGFLGKGTGKFGKLFGKASGFLGKGFGKLGGKLYSSKLGGKFMNTKLGGKALDMATNGLGFKGNIVSTGRSAVNTVSNGALDLATNGLGFKGNAKSLGMKGLGKVQGLAGKIPGIGGKLSGLLGKIPGLGGKAMGLMGKLPGLGGKAMGLMGKLPGLGGKALSLAGGLGGKAMGLIGGLGGKAAGMASGAAKAVGGLGKVAGVGGKAAGLAGGAAKAAGGLGKVAGLAGGAAKFLGPVGLAITAAQGLTGGIKGFKNAGETFGKLPGEKVTLGEKLSGGVGGTLSALSFGLLNKDKMAKGIHGIGSGIGKVGKAALKYSPIGLMGSAMGKLFGKKKDKDKDKDVDPKSADGKMVDGMEKLNKVINGGPFTKIFGARGLFMGMHKAAKESDGGIQGFFKGLFGGGKKSDNGDYNSSEGGSASNGSGSGDSGPGTGGGDVTLGGDYATDWLTDPGTIVNKSLKIQTTMTADNLRAAIEQVSPGSPLADKAQFFINASNKHNIDPLYLVSHAAVETGWGKSQICRDKHNYFGWNAVDSDPYNQATGFSSPEDGIMRGAGYIAKNYIYGKHGQDTLYKMRHNSGVHQYATDPQWHNTIATVMRNIGTANGGKGVWGGSSGVNKAPSSGTASSTGGATSSIPGGHSPMRMGEPSNDINGTSMAALGAMTKSMGNIGHPADMASCEDGSVINPANFALMSTVNNLMDTNRSMRQPDGTNDNFKKNGAMSPFSKYLGGNSLSSAMMGLKSLINKPLMGNAKSHEPTSAFKIGAQGVGPSTGERFKNRSSMKTDIVNSERNYRDNTNNSLMLKVKDVLDDIYENGQTTNELLTTLLSAIEKNKPKAADYEDAVFSNPFEMNSELKLLFNGN